MKLLIEMSTKVGAAVELFELTEICENMNREST